MPSNSKLYTLYTNYYVPTYIPILHTLLRDQNFSIFSYIGYKRSVLYYIDTLPTYTKKKLV